MTDDGDEPRRACPTCRSNVIFTEPQHPPSTVRCSNGCGRLPGWIVLLGDEVFASATIEDGEVDALEVPSASYPAAAPPKSSALIAG